jgi:hypothetical protein
MTLDLSTPESSLRAFMKARASLDGADAVTWFAGTVWAWMPGAQQRPLFGFEGFNVARALEADGGYDLLTREAAFYSDPQTGEILETWANPFTDETVKVVHVWNDPVNFPFRLDGPRGPFRAPASVVGDDVVFNSDVLLTYPSPLPRAQFPDNSQNDVYQAAELFNFFCKRAELEDDARASAPALISWTRIAPWLPFMAMGDRAGQLVYHCRGKKLDGGFAELPAKIRDYVEANDPKYASAPTEFTQPNETSWTYFRKLSGSA